MPKQLIGAPTERDPIYERLDAARKPPTNVEELLNVLDRFASRGEFGSLLDVNLAFHHLREDLGGRATEWHDALDEAYAAAEAAAA